MTVSLPHNIDNRMMQDYSTDPEKCKELILVIVHSESRENRNESITKYKNKVWAQPDLKYHLKKGTGANTIIFNKCSGIHINTGKRSMDVSGYESD
jgi:hypothetical protein